MYFVRGCLRCCVGRPCPPEAPEFVGGGMNAVSRVHHAATTLFGTVVTLAGALLPHTPRVRNSPPGGERKLVKQACRYGSPDPSFGLRRRPCRGRRSTDSVGRHIRNRRVTQSPHRQGPLARDHLRAPLRRSAHWRLAPAPSHCRACLIAHKYLGFAVHRGST